MGSRSHPFAYFLTKNLNIRYHASNIIAADLAQNYENSKLRLVLPKHENEPERSFGCTEVKLDSALQILDQVKEHKLTDIINLTSDIDDELAIQI